MAAVFAGGIIGTTGRALLIEAWPDSTGALHWPTFLANVLGALVLGWFVARGSEVAHRSELVVPFFAIGLLGSLTTFSALMVDIVESAHSGMTLGGAAYGLASVVAGLGAAAAGTALAKATR
jgi:CrcB protein